MFFLLVAYPFCNFLLFCLRFGFLSLIFFKFLFGCLSWSWESSDGDFSYTYSCALQILCLFENTNCWVNATKSLFFYVHVSQFVVSLIILFFSLETVQPKEFFLFIIVVICIVVVYRKRSFLSKQSDTLRSYRVYILPTMQASSALIQIEPFCFAKRHGRHS